MAKDEQPDTKRACDFCGYKGKRQRKLITCRTSQIPLCTLCGLSPSVSHWIDRLTYGAEEFRPRKENGYEAQRHMSALANGILDHLEKRT